MISASIKKSTRKRVYRRDGYRCALCDDARHIQVHHVIPRGEGGPGENEMNLITLCPRCHCLCHGTDIDGIGRSAEEMEQAVVEYMSDTYAEQGIIWNPWEEVQGPW